MGWSKGVNYLGEDVGYAVSAVCSQEGCDERIDRGLAYTCGGLQGHDGETCGAPFCSKHLYYGANGIHDAVCEACLEELGSRCGDAYHNRHVAGSAVCEKPDGHDGYHFGKSVSGEGVSWRQADHVAKRAGYSESA